MTDTTFPWACPVCSNPLSTQPRGMSCEQGHQFDRAKQGYVNLLLANQKNSESPGDNKAMCQARRQFFERGHYDPIRSTLHDIIHDAFAERGTVHLLDAGCGEGFYLTGLQNSPQRTYELAGIDISKFAVMLAAKQQHNIDWVCASTKHLPVLDQTLDGVLSIFAPHPAAENQRVLKTDGRWLVVSPGPEHLKEFRSFLYAEQKLTEPEHDFEGFDKIGHQSIKYQAQISDNETLAHWLAMTPFHWRGSESGREALLSQSSMSVTIHINFEMFTIHQR